MASKFANFAQGFFGGANEIQAKNAEEASKKRLLQEQSKLEMDRIRANNMSEWERQAKYIKAQSEELRKNKAFEYTLSSEEKRASREGTSKALEVYYSELEQYSDVLDDPATPEGLKMRIEGRARAKAYDMGADPEEFNNVIGSPSKGGKGVNITNQFGPSGGDLSAAQKSDLQDTVSSAAGTLNVVSDLNINLDGNTTEEILKDSPIDLSMFGTKGEIKDAWEGYKGTFSPILGNSVVSGTADKLSSLIIGSPVNMTDEQKQAKAKVNLWQGSMRAAMKALVDKGNLSSGEQKVLTRLSGQIDQDSPEYKDPVSAFLATIEATKYIRDNLGQKAYDILRADNTFGRDDLEAFFGNRDKNSTITIPEFTSTEEATKYLDSNPDTTQIKINGTLMNVGKTE